MQFEDRGMTMRFRAPAAAVTFVLGVSVLTAGCGKYSYGSLVAQKAYKEANDKYTAGDFKAAAAKYEDALKSNPGKSEVFFYLGNSYDNMFKPSRIGEAENDAYIQKAIDNYKKGAEKDPNALMRKRSLEYLVAAYGTDKLNDPAQAEPLVQKMIELEPNEPGNYFALSKIYEDAGRYEEAEAALLKGRDAKPNDPAVYATVSGYYNRQGDFPKTVEALQKAADLDPNNPQGHQLVAVFYWEKASKDHRLPVPEKKDYILKGIDATDRALALNKDYSDALTFKNILLRMQGNEEKDLVKRAALYREADELRNRAIELNKKKTSGIS